MRQMQLYCSSYSFTVPKRKSLNKCRWPEWSTFGGPLYHLDHDLGGEVLVDHEPDDCRMAVVRWICEESRLHLRDTRFIIHTHNPNAACMMVLHLQVMGFQVQASPFGVVTPTGPGANLESLAGRLLG